MNRRRMLLTTLGKNTDVTPVPRVDIRFDSTGDYAFGTDLINEKAYSFQLLLGATWMNVPAMELGAATPTSNACRIICKDAEPFINLPKGYYRATMDATGTVNLAGCSREVTVTLYFPDGSEASTATIHDDQIGNVNRHTTIIPGLYIPNAGQYSMTISMKIVPDATITYYTHKVTLDYMEEAIL